MIPLKQKLVVEQGKSFRLPVRWETEVFGYAAIAAITAAAPCRVTTSSPHGIPDGWRCAVVSARGMEEINASASPPPEDEWRRALLVSPLQIEFNDLNASDFTPYTSGGYLIFRLPQELSGFTARMSLRDKVGGIELVPMSTANGRIVIDPSAKTITLVLSAADTAAFTFRSAVYDLELISPTGEVKVLMKGSVQVIPEVTT